MTKAELEAALKTAFNRCESAACPLDERQKQILLLMVEELADMQAMAAMPSAGDRSASSSGQPFEETENPLDELTLEQRQTLLKFIRDQENQNQPWKIRLLNDWLDNRSSGSVQFIREAYGLQWLERVKPIHLAKYYEPNQDEGLRLKVGDRIEVSNGLWEWVQETGPCSREWFACTVVGVTQVDNSSVDTVPTTTSCIVRFDNGTEYEIQGIYDWNRPNWRWANA